MDKKNQASPLRDILLNTVIGASDGFIVPAALIALITAGGTTRQGIIQIVLPVTGFAALVMGLGGYLTRRNADLQPKNFVKEELAGADREKTRSFFANLGMTEEMQQTALDEMAKDDEEWSGFIDRYDMDPSVLSPAASGLVIGLGYAVAGILALLPFFFDEEVMPSFYRSAGITLGCLFILGMIRARITMQSLLVNGLRLLVTGLLAISLSYFAAKLFT